MTGALLSVFCVLPHKEVRRAPTAPRRAQATQGGGAMNKSTRRAQLPFTLLGGACIYPLVSALRAHGGSHAGVAEEGCGALKNLSFSATSLSSLKSKSSEVRPLVETAMSSHSSNTKIQEHGAFVLNKLGQ